ncbi:MAG TPA: gamma-glutamylcyclotransferase family protein [Kofleriaceae bacterium]|nr:gamma-glutamylcyclotransferase family protein [Kofleriaceae bacterium]
MSARRRSTGSMDARRTTGSNEVLDRLFVYATLRQGQTARSLIANQIVRCVEASTTGALYVFPMGYAGLLDAEAPYRVRGELLWLTELPATFGLLDAYEGDDFARVIKQVELGTGEVIWSWIYVLADPDAIKHGSLLEHGDWVRFWTEQQ